MDLPKAIFCWSGGKDSAYCLHKVLSEKLFDVKYLLTTVNDEFKRVSMHGTREELLDRQTHSIGIPSLKVRVKEGTNNEYEQQMEAVLLKAKSEGIEHVIFGDIFLEDLRAYREANLAKVNMKAVFPLWKKDTNELIDDFIRLKFRTVICCVNDGYLGEEWVGREIDVAFKKELPKNVDACGENGEYHTFCFAGPIFKKEIKIKTAEKIYRPLEIKLSEDCNATTEVVTKGFWFVDLHLA
ncbi:MAG: diphthine--ammonia ligase [Bacteroidia bacterium]|nr:diphthine--ammonia ligase [Bacteroidia bacterium]